MSHGERVIDYDPPKPSPEPPPTQIKAVYRNDLRLLKIHEAIRACFSFWLASISQYREDEKKCLIRSQDMKLNAIERQLMTKKMLELKDRIASLEGGSLWQEYVREARPILDAYSPIQTNDVKGIVNISLNSQHPEVDPDPDVVERRLELIEAYLNVARKYIQVDCTRDIEVASTCPICRKKFSEMKLDEETGTHVCQCGYERPNLSNRSSFKDSVRMNIGSRNNYDDRETFCRALDRFEGKQIDKIPAKLYQQLDAYFTSKRFPSGEEIRRLPLLPNGKRERTNTHLLIRALAETKNAAFYADVNLIGHKYWGWSLPDLTAIRDKILEDYDKTQKIYNLIKERDSSLNVNIRLCFHLMSNGYPCQLEDFKLLSQRESLEYHRTMLREMCRQTDVRYVEII